MGMDLGGMIFLQEKGFLTPEKNRLLDIGPQNIYGTTPEQIGTFVQNQGATVSPEVLASETTRLTYFSTPRPEERTTLFSEIADLTTIEYNSFDVCPGLKTELLDLNFDRLPAKYREYYDVVVNFGTTEHVFNQWNSFEVMHDALKVGGVIYHQLPASGYLDHGYYCYTPLFFRDLAKANGYVVEHLFVTFAGESVIEDVGLDVRHNAEHLKTPNSHPMERGEQRVPSFNIHAVLRKTASAPFRVSLELATAHAGAYDGVLDRYQDSAPVGLAASDVDVDPHVVKLVVERDDAYSRIADYEKSRIAIDELIRDREKKVSDLVADRERRITEIVEDRETKVRQLVAERDVAYARIAHFEKSWAVRIARRLRP